jgi:hypothetical protein
LSLINTARCISSAGGLRATKRIPIFNADKWIQTWLTRETNSSFVTN